MGSSVEVRAKLFVSAIILCFPVAVDTAVSPEKEVVIRSVRTSYTRDGLEDVRVVCLCFLHHGAKKLQTREH